MRSKSSMHVEQVNGFLRFGSILLSKQNTEFNSSYILRALRACVMNAPLKTRERASSPFAQPFRRRARLCQTQEQTGTSCVSEEVRRR